jgi:hypothetical protein
MDYIRHGSIAKNKRELKEINSFLIFFCFVFWQTALSVTPIGGTR